MRKLNLYKLMMFFLMVLGASFANAQVGIGTNTPDTSAALEILSNNRGLLLPRLTTTQRNNIALPAVGLMIFNTTTNQVEFNTGTTTSPVWSNANASTTGSWGQATTITGSNLFSDGLLLGKKNVYVLDGDTLMYRNPSTGMSFNVDGSSNQTGYVFWGKKDNAAGGFHYLSLSNVNHESDMGATRYVTTGTKSMTLTTATANTNVGNFVFDLIHSDNGNARISRLAQISAVSGATGTNTGSGNMYFSVRDNTLDAGGFHAANATLMSMIGESRNIGINNMTPSSSAILDIADTSRGVLFPRMTSAQRDAISLPANGLMIFNTNTNRVEFNTGTTTSPEWTSNVSSNIYTADGILTGDRTVNQDTNRLNFVGTGDITFNSGKVGIGTTNPIWDLDIHNNQTVSLTRLKGVGDAFNYAVISLSSPTSYWNLLHRKQGFGNRNQFTIEYSPDDASWFQYLSIDTTGRVGIGTDIPLNKLDVSGDIGLSGLAGLNLKDVSDANWRMTSLGYKLNIMNDNGGTFQNKLTITNTGNIGIGTSTPTAQLHTTGSVMFEGAGTPGAGKVLTSDASGLATWQAPPAASSVSVGTTAQRPGSPVAGMIRFNTTTNKFEGYDGTNWVDLN